MNPLHSLLLGAYGGLWRAATPLLRRHHRLREGFEQRLVPQGWPDGDAGGWPGPSPGKWPGPLGPSAPRLWIQAASGGEAWLVHSLLPALARTPLFRAGDVAPGSGSPAPGHPAATGHPVATNQAVTTGQALSAPASPALPPLAQASGSILCTTCTRQGLEVLEKLPLETVAPDAAPWISCADPPPRTGLTPVLPTVRPPVMPPAIPPVWARYLPLDRPDLMRRAMARVKPDVLVLLETELWPGLLAAAKAAGVPVVIVNARMTAKSLSAYRLTASFLRSLAPRAVLAISEPDAARFAALFGERCRVGVMPNIKFDRLAQGMTAPPLGDEPVAAAGYSRQRLLAAMASVREEEEDLLLPALAELHGASVDGVPIALAVAPRHMHRVEAWRHKLEARGIPYALRSEMPGPPGPGPVCLWDTFGELRALYAMADTVFVGGSMARLGGQNYLEPLAEGVIPLVGPHLDNFLWVGESLFEQGLAVRVAGPEDLAEALRKGMSRDRAAGSRDTRQGVRERFFRWLADRTGGSGQAARLIADVALRLRS